MDQPYIWVTCNQRRLPGRLMHCPMDPWMRWVLTRCYISPGSLRAKGDIGNIEETQDLIRYQLGTG